MFARLIALLLLFPVFSNASGWFGAFGDKLPVYIIGDASGVADGLNFVAMIVNSTAMQGLVLAGVMVALIRIAMKLYAQSAEGSIAELMYIIAVLFFFLTPSTSVVVQDARVYKGGMAPPDVTSAASTGYISYQVIDNIPIGIAAIASFSTTVGWDLAALVDTVIAPVIPDGQYLGVTKAGINQPAKDMRWILNNIATGIAGEKGDHDYEYMFHEYVTTCAIPTISLDIRNSHKIMSPPDGDYMTYLSPSELPVAGTMVQDPVTNTRIDCKDFWDNNLANAKVAFEDNILQQFRDYKKFDVGGSNTQSENALRHLINAESTTAIASLKDTLTALKRAAEVAGATNSATTGIEGIDMSNRMAMTASKQNMMVQGPAQFAWLGEVLPMAINIGFGFLIVMSVLMAVFLLFQGWVKGVKVILNFASGFFALAFSYVSLAVTQGIVNRRAFAENLEQYTSQGSPLQVTNYNHLLEQAATMDGLTGLLGTLFVGVGSAVVFYGESKMLVGGLMGKVAGSFGGNNLDQTSEDNAKDTALSTSMAEAERKNKMAGKLSEAGIPYDGGNIEFEYAKMQKELSDIGAARGSHMAITEGDTSAEASENRTNMIAGSGMQSFEKSKSLQGYGHEALKESGNGKAENGSLEKATSMVSAGSFAKGRSGAAASIGESEMLQDPKRADAFVEGVKRDAQVKTAKTIGAGVAEPTGGMDKYLDSMERAATVGFLDSGVKAEASADRRLKKGSRTQLDSDYEEGLYRGEASAAEATKQKARVVDGSGNTIGREDYIKNSAASALKSEVVGQADGQEVRKRFGDGGHGLAISVPYAGSKEGEKPDTPKSENSSETSSGKEKVKMPTVPEIYMDMAKIKTPEQMVQTATDGTKEPSNASLPKSVFSPTNTTSSETNEEKNTPNSTERTDSKKEKGYSGAGSSNSIGLPFSEQATPSEEKLMKATGLSLDNVRRNKNTIVSHESSGNLQKRLSAENDYGYIGMAQFGAAALVDTGLVKRDKYIAATHKIRNGRRFNRGVTQKSFLADDDNWNLKGGKAAFKSSFAVQDKALNTLMAQNARTLKRNGVDLGSSSNTKGLLMAAHLGGAGHTIDFAKKGRGFRDANGTSIGSYYNAGTKDVTKGWGGTKNSSGGGVRNTNTGSMGIGGIAAAHARKSNDEWIASGQSIANTYQQDPSAYSTSAAFREAGSLMNAQSIAAKGGLKSAIQMGTASAAAAGSAERGEFVGKSTQQLMSQGFDSDTAKKMAKSIASGSEEGAEKFKKAIMSASGSASQVLASEKEGGMQSHAAKLKEEFGETLTEKESSASGKTFNEEQKTISNDAQTKKEEQWKKRKEGLEAQKEQMELFTGDDKKVAAHHVKSVLNGVVDSDPSLNNSGKRMARQSINSLSNDILSGKEVTTKEIKSALGNTVGTRAISALEANGVEFKDADSLMTGNAINAQASGAKLKKAMANEVILGAVSKQKEENVALAKTGAISQDELSKRNEKLDYIQMGVNGKNGGSMPFEYFKEGGFNKERLNDLGIEYARSSHKTDDGRMRAFQVSRVNTDSILDSAVKNIDKKSKEEMPKSEPVPQETTSPKKENVAGKSHSWNELMSAQEGKKVDEFIGSGSGIIENTSRNPKIYSENAMYGEMSKASTTEAKIDAQGGIKNAVNIDTMESTMKAGSQRGAVTAQAEEFLKSTGQEGGSAEKIVEGMTKGGDIASKMISSGIVSAAASLAGAQMGAKTGADLATVGEYDGKESYVKAARRDAIDKTTKSRIMSEMSESPEKTNRVVQEEKAQMQHAGKLKEYIEDGQKYGFLDDQGNAKSGEEWVRGRAEFSASGMNKNEQGMIGGARVSTAFNAATGEAITNVDGVRNISMGTKTNANVGDTGDIAAQTSRESMEHLLNPKKLISAAVGTVHNTVSGAAKSVGMSDEAADTTATGVSLAVGGVATAGMAEAGQRAYNYKTGKLVAKEDFSVPRTDSEGKPVLDESGKQKVDHYKEGQKLDVGRNEKLGEFIKEHDIKVKPQSGYPAKVLGGAIDKYDNLVGGESSSKSLDSTNDSTNNIQDTYTDNKVKSESDNSVKHDKTPSNKDAKVNENPLTQSNNNENTQTSQADDRKSNNLTPESVNKLKSIEAADSAELGKSEFRQKAKTKQLEVREALADATLVGDEAKVAKLSEQDGALSKVVNAIDSDQPVKASLAKSAGISTNHTISPDGKPFNETVNFDSIGETKKVSQKAQIVNDPKNHIAPNVSESTHTPTNQAPGQKSSNIDSKSNADLGRETFREKAAQKQLEVRGALQDADRNGDAAKVEKLSEQDGALKKVIKSIDDGKSVSAMDAKNAGIPTNHTNSPDGKPFNATVDFESIGETKAQVMNEPRSSVEPSVPDASATLDTPKEKSGDVGTRFEERHNLGAKEPVVPETHVSTPKSKVGKILQWGAGALGVSALFSSSADASVKPSAIAEVDALPTKELSDADQAGFAMGAAGNTVQAGAAALEMKQGASSKVGDLAKGSSYIDGAKSVVKDAVDVSDFKGVAKGFADDGAVMGAKLAGKALTKSAMKKLPIAGVAAGAYFAAERAEAGDYMGAAMEFASGAVSLIPGVGTAASVAIDGALMKRDYDAATEGQPQEATAQAQAGQAQVEPISSAQSGNPVGTSSTPRGSDVNVQGTGTMSGVQPNASGPSSSDVEKEVKGEEISTTSRKVNTVKENSESVTQRVKGEEKTESIEKIDESKGGNTQTGDSKTTTSEEAAGSEQARVKKGASVKEVTEQGVNKETIEAIGSDESKTSGSNDHTSQANTQTKTADIASGVSSDKVAQVIEGVQAENSEPVQEEAPTIVINSQASPKEGSTGTVSSAGQTIESGQHDNAPEVPQDMEASQSVQGGTIRAEVPSSNAQVSPSVQVNGGEAPQMLSAQEQSTLTPSQKINTLNERVQSMSNDEAGESYISTVAPKGNASKIIEEAKAGTLTREKLIEHGVPADIAQTVPVSDNGTTTTSQMGEMYKEGTAQIAGVVAASENPTIKYGNGLGNSVSSGDISSVAASSMAEPFDPRSIEAPAQTSSTEQASPAPKAVQQASVAQAVPSMPTDSGENMSALQPVNNIDIPAPMQGATVANSTQSAISAMANAANNPIQPAQTTTEQTSTIASEVASAGNAPQQSVIRERVVESPSTPVNTDPLTDMGASGGRNEVQEFARNATSPGNIQTSSSDIKKSIDDVSAAMESAKAASPEQIDLNSLALGDLANGMAMSAPLQTTTGELTVGNKDGYMTLGQGEGAIQTHIPSEILQGASSDTVDKFAATLSNSKISNESVAEIKDETEYGSIGIASTSEMLHEMGSDNRKSSLDARISGGDQVSLLEDLVDNMEKMQVSLAPTEEKKVV